MPIKDYHMNKDISVYLEESHNTKIELYKECIELRCQIKALKEEILALQEELKRTKDASP